MGQSVIPWKLLEGLGESSGSKDVTKKYMNLEKQPKSFVEVIDNVCNILLSQLLKSCVKGNKLAIVIPEEEYLLGLKACKHNLHRGIFWKKGATLLTVQNLKNKLLAIWSSIGKWGITSLGKGYFEFYFSSIEDVRRVRSITTWNLNPGLLKLFPWPKDFNPYLLKQFSAQVWVHTHGLPQEYLRPKTVFAIASNQYSFVYGFCFQQVQI
ncbi:unnamed protein product [Lathyrus sativus]|nr:unnamed protein product [Lathyrus sativus]